METLGQLWRPCSSPGCPGGCSPLPRVCSRRAGSWPQKSLLHQKRLSRSRLPQGRAAASTGHGMPAATQLAGPPTSAGSYCDRPGQPGTSPWGRRRRGGVQGRLPTCHLCLGESKCLRSTVSKYIKCSNSASGSVRERTDSQDSDVCTPMFITAIGQ